MANRYSAIILTIPLMPESGNSGIASILQEGWIPPATNSAVILASENRLTCNREHKYYFLFGESPEMISHLWVKYGKLDVKTSRSVVDPVLLLEGDNLGLEVVNIASETEDVAASAIGLEESLDWLGPQALARLIFVLRSLQSFKFFYLVLSDRFSSFKD